MINHNLSIFTIEGIENYLTSVRYRLFDAQNDKYTQNYVEVTADELVQSTSNDINDLNIEIAILSRMLKLRKILN